MTVKSWSTDSTYTAPGESYDGTDTKVEPGSGLVEEGIAPGGRLNAQHFNFLLNVLFGACFDPADGGIESIRVAADTLALAAIAPNTDNVVALVPGYGIYYYLTGSSTAHALPFVVSTGGSTGRWIHALYPNVAGANSGLATLGSGGKVPDLQLGRGSANGVAPLNGSSKVDNTYLNVNTANGICPLNASSKVPSANLASKQLVDMTEGHMGTGDPVTLVSLASDPTDIDTVTVTTVAGDLVTVEVWFTVSPISSNPVNVWLVGPTANTKKAVFKGNTDEHYFSASLTLTEVATGTSTVFTLKGTDGGAGAAEAAAFRFRQTIFR